jgi:hypothetical protein
MSFDLFAIITRADQANSLATKLWGPAVPLEQGLALIPVPENPAGDRPYAAMQYLSRQLADLLRSTSQSAPVAYVEAQDELGVGGQSAIVWTDGKVVYGPDELVPGAGWREGGGPIDGALRELGARRGAEGDEFIAVGLGRFRHTRQWATIPDLVERLPAMELVWTRKYDWADYFVEVEGTLFGITDNGAGSQPRYALTAIGLRDLATYDSLPPTWRVKPDTR